MGSTVETVVMAPLDGLTKAPTCNCAIPGMPSIGETSRVNPKLMLAVSASALADATAAVDAMIWALAVSTAARSVSD